MIVKCVKAAYNKYATSGTNIYMSFYGGNYLLSLLVIISARFDVAWCDVLWHFVTSVGVIEMIHSEVYAMHERQVFGRRCQTVTTSTLQRLYCSSSQPRALCEMQCRKGNIWDQLWQMAQPAAISICWKQTLFRWILIMVVL